MLLDQPTPRWKQELYTVVVGVRSTSGTVEKVYVHRDGRMAGAVRVHRLPKGRPALDEAVSVFGLSQAKEFPVLLLMEADLYAVRLRRGLAPH